MKADDYWRLAMCENCANILEDDNSPCIKRCRIYKKMEDKSLYEELRKQERLQYSPDEKGES